MEELNCGLHAELIEFSAFLSTARVLLVAVRGELGSRLVIR